MKQIHVLSQESKDTYGIHSDLFSYSDKGLKNMAKHHASNIFGLTKDYAEILDIDYTYAEGPKIKVKVEENTVLLKYRELQNISTI